MDLEAAYDRFGARLYRHALALTGQPADAEDALQGVFLKLARRPPSGARIRDLEAYLHTAIRREALRLTARRRREVVLDDVDAGDAPSLVAAANGTVPEEVEALNRAVLRLPAEQREVLQLHVWEGMTFRRIGELLRISPDTAASRYRYAREKLGEWLHGRRQ